MPSRLSPDAFLDRIDKTATCWIWTGATLQNGYGRFSAQYAHRVSYERFVGPIPEGLEIDHLCRVRACINPDHLEAVTHAENLRRARPYRKLRPASAPRPAKSGPSREESHAAHLQRVRVLMGWS